MRIIGQHPPAPTLTIRVGVTGACRPVGVSGLPDQIRTILRIVKEIVSTIHREPDSGYDAEVPPQLIIVCALAAGADQFAADIAIEEGYQLHVPLAYHHDKYVELTFARHSLTGEAEHFERLYAAAVARLELDGAETESEAYDHADTVLVERSDLLLVIRDGNAAHRTGDSPDSVAKAVAAGIPVVKLNPESVAEVELEYGSTRALTIPELTPILRDILQDGLRAPHSLDASEKENLESEFTRERKQLQVFLRERKRRMDWSLPYQAVTGLLALRFPRFHFRAESFLQASESAWAPVQDTHPDCAREFFRNLDLWPDSLAVYYSNWMRGLVSLMLALGSIVIAYVLAQRLWYKVAFPPRVGNALTVVTPLSILLIWYARHRSVHRRWLQYRLLSQGLRDAALALAIGGSGRRSASYREVRDFKPNWVAFYVKASIRTFGLGNAVFDANYLRDYRALLATRVASQYSYHWRRSRNYAILNRNIRRVGFTAFLISLLGAMLHIIQSINPTWFDRELGAAALQNLGGVSLECTVFSAAIAAFAAQESYAKLAQSSATTAIQLNELGVAIQNSLLSSMVLGEKAGQLIEEMRREHEDWYVLYSLRDIDYS